MPEWAGDTVSSGGPGFLDAHRTGWTTQYLEPGSYILECYVMDDTGAFHNMSGMLEKLVVTEDVSAAAEPDADLAVSISSTGGIVFEAEDVQPGAYNVSVTFEDNAVYGHGLGHDVHLIRLENGTTVEDVNGWINYLDVAEDGFYADRGAGFHLRESRARDLPGRGPGHLRQCGCRPVLSDYRLHAREPHAGPLCLGG